jgi:hypothetical protein
MIASQDQYYQLLLYSLSFKLLLLIKQPLSFKLFRFHSRCFL